MNWCQQNDIFYILSQLVLAKHNEEKGGGRIAVLILHQADTVNHAEELHHACAKAEEISSVYPLFRLPSTLIEKGNGAEKSKEGLKDCGHLEHGPRLDILDNTSGCPPGVLSNFFSPEQTLA